MNVAIAHDYLTQRGGAERVVLSMLDAFPGAPLYTTLYEPEETFAEFGDATVRPSALNRVPLFRQHHRLAFPLLAPTVSNMHVDADVVVCSSSGWAHGVAAEGRRIVYCHAPARWLYQRETYLRELGPGARAAQRVLQGPLERWDRRAAASAERYVVNSSHIARSIRELYDRDAEVLPPPSLLSETDERRSVAVPGTGFMLCVSRLLSYKNVDAIVAAFRELPRERLVVVGSGPDQLRLEALAGGNVTLLHGVDDAQLRWLYANAVALVAASYEDFGLTPLEAATFGKPTIALHFGGFLDTVVEGRTGHFFDQPEPNEVASAIRDALRGTWDAEEIKAHAARFSQPRFVNRLRAIVAEAAS